MTWPFTQTYAADAASPTCQVFWVQSIWAPHVAHGSDRRSVFSTTVTRLPKLHEREQRVCRRDAFLYCPCIFRLLCRLDLSVGRSSRFCSTSPRGGNRAGVAFCGAQDFRTLHGCRRASERRLQQGPALRLTQIASPIFRYELVTRAPVGSVVQAEFARKDCPSANELGGASALSPSAARNTAVGSLVALSEYRVCVIRYSPELGRTAQADG
jgi:hypothetical protein